MSDKIYKVGIIGCGGIATWKHMPSLGKLKNVQMVAFCDLIEEKAIKAAKEHGDENAKVYTDYKELLKDTSIDIIHVCTPNKSHSPITVDALESGKHVMCEKPMAKTPAEAQKMIDAAKRTGKKLTIGYQTRQRGDAQYLKKICQDGDLGEIYFAKAHALRRRAVPTWGVFLNEEEQGGGPLIDIGTHAIDLTLWEMNNYEPQMVVGSVFKKLSENIGEGTGNLWGDWDPKQYTVEDSAFGFIKMKNGATIMLESSWALNMVKTPEAKTTLCGTKGGADMNDDKLTINTVKHGRMVDEQVNFEAGGVAFFEGENGKDPSLLEAAQWINAIDTDTEPCVLPEQALVVTQILDAIYESSKTGKPIYFS